MTREGLEKLYAQLTAENKSLVETKIAALLAEQIGTVRKDEVTSK